MLRLNSILFIGVVLVGFLTFLSSKNSVNAAIIPQYTLLKEDLVPVTRKKRNDAECQIFVDLDIKPGDNEKDGEQGNSKCSKDGEDTNDNENPDDKNNGSDKSSDSSGSDKGLNSSGSDSSGSDPESENTDTYPPQAFIDLDRIPGANEDTTLGSDSSGSDKSSDSSGSDKGPNSSRSDSSGSDKGPNSSGSDSSGSDMGSNSSGSDSSGSDPESENTDTHPPQAFIDLDRIPGANEDVEKNNKVPSKGDDIDQ